MPRNYNIPVYRVALVRESGLSASPEEVVTPVIATRIALSYLGDVDREHFVAMLLDGKNHVIGINTVSVGTLTGAMVHPREVFKPAILANANSIIIAHNHPSGDPQPSPEDIELFGRIREAGHMLGIKIHDAIILGFEEHYSAASGATFTLPR